MSTSGETHLKTFVSAEPDTLHKADYTDWRLVQTNMGAYIAFMVVKI